MKMGQTNVSHRITFDDAAGMYKLWRDKQESINKIVIDFWAESAAA
jgi:threonine dehydrogenase-like Zn-dependent dehydrogenase